MPSKIQTQWIATADERRATLYSFRTTPGGRWQAEACKTLESPWEDYHEHHRPSALGRGPTANAAQHFASTGHDVEEEHRRFARNVAQWVAQTARNSSIEHISLFAAPRFLGELRRQFDHLDCPVELFEGELTRLTAAELCDEPAVIDALERRRESAQT